MKHDVDPELAELRTIPEIAGSLNMSRATLHRRLVSLHKKDVDAGCGGWLITDLCKQRVRHRVNLSALLAVHPELGKGGRTRLDHNELSNLRHQVERLGEELYEQKLWIKLLRRELAEARAAVQSVVNGTWAKSLRSQIRDEVIAALAAPKDSQPKVVSRGRN